MLPLFPSTQLVTPQGGYTSFCGFWFGGLSLTTRSVGQGYVTATIFAESPLTRAFNDQVLADVFVDAIMSNTFQDESKSTIMSDVITGVIE